MVVGEGRGVDGNEQMVKACLINQSPFTLPSNHQDPQIILAQNQHTQDNPRNSSALLQFTSEPIWIIWLMIKPFSNDTHD
jgi:hypothetical protein